MGGTRKSKKTAGAGVKNIDHSYNLRRRKVSKSEEVKVDTERGLEVTHVSKQEQSQRNLQKRLRTEPEQKSIPSPMASPLLPAEIWLMILTNLRVSQFDLLSLRLVCRQWKTFVDEMLTKKAKQCVVSSWKNDQVQYGRDLWIGEDKELELVASRFSTWEQLDSALAFPPDQNPFPAGVVVLAPYFEKSTFQNQDVERFGSLVPPFLERFRKWILTLVCFFGVEGEQSSYARKLLQNNILSLDNLCHLYIYNYKWTLSDLVGDLMEPTSDSGRDRKLSHLYVGGTGFTSEHLFRAPPIRLFAQFPTVIGSLTSLEFEWPWYDESEAENAVLHHMETNRFALHCPNLQRLKIRGPTVQLFKFFCNAESFPKLTEISFMYDLDHDWWLEYRNISDSSFWLEILGLFRLLDFHRSNLTRFTFIFRSIVPPEWDAVEAADVDVGGAVPGVKQLTIHLYIFAHMGSELRPEYSAFFRKFTNLEQLVIIGSLSEIYDDDTYEIPWSSFRDKVREGVSSLWGILPETVTNIMLPEFRNMVVKKGESIPASKWRRLKP